MKNSKIQDIFISYRRVNGLSDAYSLYKYLFEKKYSVFFDISSMGSGFYPHQLEEGIKNSKDFILVVSAVQEIINKTLEAEGVSDRLSGRKFYFWLDQANFTDIKIYIDAINTASMSYEQKQNLFNESFSYRINYFRKQYEKNQDDESYELMNWMESKLVELEDLFYSSSFWYFDPVFIAVGKK